jgi:type IV pilus assembly protein PilE
MWAMRTEGRGGMVHVASRVARKEIPFIQTEMGFSMIEMMIVLGITGLLAMVAYPSYQDSVRRARRADGIAAALMVQVAQEKFRASCPFYAQSLGSIDVCGTNAGASTVQAASTSPEGYYTISVAEGSASSSSYTISADPTGTQANDTTCDPMTITFNASNPGGLKAPADCW